MSNFPSLEELDADLPSTSTPPVENEADFLSREQAVLGDDASAFQTGQEVTASADDEFDDGAFQSAPAAAASPVPADSAAATPAPGLHYTEKYPLEASEPVREWKARQELEIARRDEVSESKHKETLEKAKQDIDDFYENYNTKRDDVIAKTKEEEAKFLEERDSVVGGSGSTWDRIAALVNTSEKSANKARFREILLSLKGDVNAPGASGA